MRLRPPRDVRDILRMLAFYESERGLDGVIDRFDLEDVAPWHLNRVLAIAPGRTQSSEVDAAVHLKTLLLSDDFRRLAVRNLLHAFPDKPRLLFVHIPKCAGTDLTRILAARHFTISSGIENPHWFTHDALFLHLRELVLGAEFANSIFLSGHTRLRYCVNQNLIRPGDQIFTVVRDPIDVVISAVNYRLTRLKADPTGRATDTRLWLRDLGLQQISDDATQSELRAIAKRMLREPRVVEDNVLCLALGSGDAASALANIVTSDIEITDLRRYEAWLRQRWGATSQHSNASMKVLTADTLDVDDRMVIEAKTAQDRILFPELMRALNASGALSITGRCLGGHGQ